MIGEIVNTATVVGTAAGYTAGQFLEHRAQVAISNNRLALIRGHEGMTGDRVGLLKRSIAGLALLGAATGFAYAKGATTTEALSEPPAALAVVADHSYHTSLDHTAGEINEAADTFLSVNPHNMYVAPVVAHNSSFDTITLKQLSKDRPYGNASALSEATKEGIDLANSHKPPVESNTFGSKGGETAGVLVLTDDHNIGDVKADEGKNRLPLFIANFGSNTGTTATELKADAKSTGGHYIADARKDPKAVINYIKGKILTHPVAEKSTSGRLPWLLMGLGLTAISARQYSRRKKEIATP